MITVESLLAAWRADAARLRAWGSGENATVLERCADELDAQLEAWASTPLTLAEAAAECGYSVGHLRRLVTKGILQDEATDGEIQVRRGALPWKAEAVRTPSPLGVLSPI